MEDKLHKIRLGDLLRQGAQEVGVSLGDLQIELFGVYLQELLEWNKTFNLTGIRDPEDIVIEPVAKADDKGEKSLTTH